MKRIAVHVIQSKVGPYSCYAKSLLLIQKSICLVSHVCCYMFSFYEAGRGAIGP
jgi:hypothetical protein